MLQGSGCRRPCGAAPQEGRNVSAAWQLDAQRIVAARAGVVARQRAAQPPGFDAHDRIALRIEIAAAAERLDGDRVGLDAVAVARERRFHDKCEKVGQPQRVAEGRTAHNTAELTADLIALRRLLCRMKAVGEYLRFRTHLSHLPKN